MSLTEIRSTVNFLTELGLTRSPDAIAVLSGGQSVLGYRQDRKADGRFSCGLEVVGKPTRFTDLDIKGLMGGGEERVAAAAVLAEVFLQARIVTNSIFVKTGEGENGRDVIYRDARVYAKALMEINPKLKPRIIRQEKSDSTAKELVELTKLAVQNGWKNMLVITNGYHVPRVVAMYDNLSELFSSFPNGDYRSELADAMSEFGEQNGRFEFVKAEAILIRMSSRRFDNKIRQAYNPENPAYLERKNSEKKGLKDIKTGNYHIE